MLDSIESKAASSVSSAIREAYNRGRKDERFAIYYYLERAYDAHEKYQDGDCCACRQIDLADEIKDGYYETRPI
jgi:hypothetical protein